MYIEELNEGGEVISTKEQFCDDLCRGEIVVSGSKRALVGVGARALFYPTLLYNVVRNKIQTEFRWWDRVGEFVLLGAVPFPADVPRLKALGVAGVITLNEPYETLVPTSLYLDHGIDHLVIPTRDYLFAPSDSDINCAVEFIHGNASCGKTTYVHCKAGRGRSTTIVLCYLVKHKHMTPEAAFDYVRSIRPRVLLASSQWQAVREYYLQVKKSERDVHIGDNLIKASNFPAQRDLDVFDDSSVVLVSKSDLDGYDETIESGLEDKQAMAVLNVACRVQFASQAAITRLSCLWLRCHSSQKIPTKKAGGSVTSNQLESVGIDIHVY